MKPLIREAQQLLERLSGLGIPAEDAGADIQDIYAASWKLELPLIDYMTLRDLVELGGCQEDGPLAAVLMTLFRALQEGSLCIDLEEERLCAGLMRFLEAGQAGKMATAFLSGLSKDMYKALITRNSDDYLPLVLSATGNRSLLYFQKFHVHEHMLRKRMEALLQAQPSIRIPESDIDAFIDGIYSPEHAIRVGKEGRPIERDAQQVEALRMSLKSQFAIISGGPGTGKTSLMVNILRCLLRAGIRAGEILLGAPTGRAAQRMTEAVQRSINTISSPGEGERELLDLKGSTLHKLLRYRGAHHDFYYGETNPLPASVIILDEVSMVDVIMMERFLRAVDASRTRLIFLGDKDQLPSVEAGAVFAEMIPDGTRAERFKDRLIVLDTVYRSGKNLLHLAGQINQGMFPEYAPVSFASALHLATDRWAVVPDEGVRAWREHLRLWVDHHYLSPVDDDGRDYTGLASEAGGMEVGSLLHADSGKEILGRLFERVEQARILSLVRNGIYGCNGINQEIAGRLGAAVGEPAWMERGYFGGAVIMITRNDYAKALFNGDVGVVIRNSDGAYRAFFPRFGTYIAFSMDMLPPWELAFSMTVHKSQGSEFDDVLLVLPQDDTHRLLTREIVYTGVTRARKRIIIHGTESVLKNALKQKIERQSGLEW
ncbi:MAG: exodeoxyribonuclease V subunit alpha [Deltaproteobacteria bacterium]|nr:exodeoxyribonuclease V subunit alpha [Deltaproteobacteria bacterium]